jgi:prolyl oligopeptidase PreP (S9A serine peptidase family)
MHYYIHQGGAPRLRASPTRVQQKFANEQDGTKRMFFVVTGRRAKVLK